MTARPSAPLRLPQARRLSDSRVFARLKAEGRRAVCGCLIANWTPLPPGSLAQVGVVTSRKIGGAVVRSRARRLLREVYRLHQHDLNQPVALVLIARASIAEKRLRAVEHDFLAFLRQAHLANVIA